MFFKKNKPIKTESEWESIVLWSPDFSERMVAISYISNQDFLAHIATNDNNERIRLAATCQLNDQQALARIATQDVSAYVRLVAIIRLQDEDLLRQAISSEHDDVVLAFAQAHLSKLLSAK